MKKEITKYEFLDAFDGTSYCDNFTYDGRLALYDYLTDLEEATGIEMELDIVAICCDYNETSYWIFASDCNLDCLQDYENKEIDEDEFKDLVEEYIKNETIFIEVTDDTFIFQVY